MRECTYFLDVKWVSKTLQKLATVLRAEPIKFSDNVAPLVTRKDGQDKKIKTKPKKRKARSCNSGPLLGYIISLFTINVSQSNGIVNSSILNF